jgi:hypothetical protein
VAMGLEDGAEVCEGDCGEYCPISTIGLQPPRRNYLS